MQPAGLAACAVGAPSLSAAWRSAPPPPGVPAPCTTQHDTARSARQRTAALGCNRNVTLRHRREWRCQQTCFVQSEGRYGHRVSKHGLLSCKAAQSHAPAQGTRPQHNHRTIHPPPLPRASSSRHPHPHRSNSTGSSDTTCTTAGRFLSPLPPSAPPAAGSSESRV